MVKKLGLLGGGSQADEVELYTRGQFNVVFRAVSAQYLSADSSELIDIAHPGSHSATPVIAAVGAPALRRAMVQKWPGKQYATFIAEGTYIDPKAHIGEGSIIAPGVIMTTRISIGSHVLINIGVTISHDCKIGNFVTISPGVHIGGGVEIGDGAFIGIGATISNGVKIAAGSVIGGGALIRKDVAEKHSVMVGVPAKCIRNNQEWLSKI